MTRSLSLIICLGSLTPLVACTEDSDGDAATDNEGSTGADASSDDDDGAEATTSETSAGSTSGASTTATSTTSTSGAATTDASETGADETSTTGPVIPETSPGCGTPLSTDWLETYTVYWDEEALVATIDVGGESRQFLIELPENYDPDNAYPVVFTLHGYNALMDNAYGQRIAQAWDYEVIAIYPQSSGPGWDTNPGGADFSFFTGMLNEVGAMHCLDMNRIFVQGFSMGGIMANALGCARGDIFDGVGATASNFPLSSDQCTGALPAWVMHGRNDNTVPFTSGEQVRDIWLGLNGCNEVTQPVPDAPCVEYTECEGAPVMWCAHDGAHDVPKNQGLDDDMNAFLQSL